MKASHPLQSLSILFRLILAATAVTLQLPLVALAEEPAPRAIIAVLGDADRFSVGQDGYCGKRTDIDKPRGAQFTVPSNTETVFFIHTSFNTPTGTHSCDGDFSFIPGPSKLHIIRFTFLGEKCRLELFGAVPGSDPHPFPFKSEARRSCLAD